MPWPALRRATCLATTLQRCQRACEARLSPERAASINSVDSGGLACSPIRACRGVTYLQNTQNCRKSNGCIEDPAGAFQERRGARAERSMPGTACVALFLFGKPARGRTTLSPTQGRGLSRARSSLRSEAANLVKTISRTRVVSGMSAGHDSEGPVDVRLDCLPTVARAR